jgi:hypothetical protein
MILTLVKEPENSLLTSPMLGWDHSLKVLGVYFWTGFFFCPWNDFTLYWSKTCPGTVVGPEASKLGLMLQAVHQQAVSLAWTNPVLRAPPMAAPWKALGESRREFIEQFQVRWRNCGRLKWVYRSLGISTNKQTWTKNIIKRAFSRRLKDGSILFQGSEQFSHWNDWYLFQEKSVCVPNFFHSGFMGLTTFLFSSSSLAIFFYFVYSNLIPLVLSDFLSIFLYYILSSPIHIGKSKCTRLELKAKIILQMCVKSMVHNGLK